MNDTRDHIKRGLFWLGGSTVASRLLDVGAMIIVVKILGRPDLGLATMASSITAVLEAASGLGVGTALVRADSPTRRQLSTLTWFSTGLAVLVGAAVVLLSGWLASLWGEQQLRLLLRVAAFKLVVVAAALVPLQLLVRDLRFGEVAVVQSTATGVESVGKVVLAFAGLGAWALLLAELARALTVLIGALYCSRFKPQLRFSIQDLRWYVAFGMRASLSTVLTEIYKNLDYFLVGRVLGMATLGVYRLAFQIAVTTVDAVAQPVYRATYPVLARVGNSPKQLVDAFTDSSRYLLTLTAPLAVFVYACGDDLLAVATADRWLEAGSAIRILCWAALLRAVTRLFDNFFYALSRPGLALLDSVLTLTILGVAMPAFLLVPAAPDMLSVCHAWMTAYPVVFVVLFLVARSVAPLASIQYLVRLGPLLAAGALTLVALHSANAVLVDAVPWQRLAVSAAAGLTVYVGAIRLLAGIHPGRLKVT